MKWEKWFSSIILERGKKYYRAGNVSIDYQDESIVEATVVGSDFYNVELTLEQGEIVDVLCDCPHYESGYLCKHLVATIMELPNANTIQMDLNKQVTQPTATPKQVTALELLSKSTDTQRIEFLEQELKADKSMYKRFKKYIHYVDELETLDDFKRKIDEYIEECTEIEEDDDYYYDYYEDEFPTYIFGLDEKLNEFTHKYLEPMYKRKEYTKALDILEYILTTLDNEDISEVDKCLHIILGQCMYLKEYKNLEKEIFTILFLNIKKLKDRSQIIKLILKFLVLEYKGEFLQELLDYSYIRLEKGRNMNDDYLHCMSQELWGCCIIYTLNKINKDFQEIRDFVHDHIIHMPIQDAYLNVCRNERKEEQEAILKYILFTDSYSRTRASDALSELEQLYVEMDRHSNRQALLLEVLVNHTQLMTKDYYYQLKGYYQEGWDELYEDIIQRIEKEPFITTVYLEEKDYQRLINHIISKDDITLVSRYREALNNHYPEELRMLYKKEISYLIQSSGTRKHYQYIASLLKEMTLVNGGQEEVDALLETYKIKYKARKAMLEEFRFLLDMH